MTRALVMFLMLALISVGSANTAAAAGSTARPKHPATQAKVRLEVARATALKTVPGATVKSEELEREHGKLIYSFDLEVAGKTGIQEVQVDAVNGRIVSNRHETPKAEHKEQQQEKREAAHTTGK